MIQRKLTKKVGTNLKHPHLALAKPFIFTLLALLLASTLHAQNTTMARAFFEKAQREYENENYKDAFDLVKKTKENLNGETNPEVMYLEAKIRLESDLNINFSKELFYQFLDEADPNDGRISEVSSTLVDIETSGAYFENGQKKWKAGINENGREYIYKYSECYMWAGSYNITFLETEEKYETTNYYVGGIKVFAENKADGQARNQSLYSQNEGATLVTTIFMTMYGKGNENQLIRVELPKAGSQECEDDPQYVSLMNPNEASSFKYYDDSGTDEVQLLSIDEDGATLTAYLNEEVINEVENIVYEETIFHPFPSDILGVKDFWDKGKVKRVKSLSEYDDKVFWLTYFTKNGLPEKMEYYKKSKLKETYFFDFEVNEWKQ